MCKLLTTRSLLLAPAAVHLGRLPLLRARLLPVARRACVAVQAVQAVQAVPGLSTPSPRSKAHTTLPRAAHRGAAAMQERAALALRRCELQAWSPLLLRGKVEGCRGLCGQQLGLHVGPVPRAHRA